MIIKPKDPDQRDAIVAAIKAWLEKSRFTARVESDCHHRYKHIVNIEIVRKRKKDYYCGQHPNGCIPNPFRGDRPERKGHWLEGADWVGWNDGLNGVLDAMAIDADVWSYNRESGAGRYYIRQGLKRRTTYDSVFVSRGFGFYHWATIGEFENWVGREAPTSSFPYDTPGLADWRPEVEEKETA